MLYKAGGQYTVQCGEELYEATLRGRIKHSRSVPKLLVGDVVHLAITPEGNATIESVAERRSVLRRRTPGRRRGVRDVAANLDQVVVVGSMRDPDWKPSQIDRFVVVAVANRLPCIIVVNKVDLKSGDTAAAVYAALGYTVFQTSVAQARGLEAVREALEGRISLLTGPSGAGKSSLANALEPGLNLRTSPVSKRSRGGRHTTVAARMFRLSGGGFLVDTPGLRDIGLWGVTASEVQEAYPEIARAGASCRFDDCRHLTEPGCAVVEQVGGKVSSGRLTSYRHLLAEAMDARESY